MHELIYVSAARRPFDTAQLAAVLEQSRRNNAKVGVTGILLYEGGSFLQVLEGEREVVEALYQRVAGDDRHYRLQRLRARPIATRSFAAWTMGFVSLDPKLALPQRHALLSNGSLEDGGAELLAFLDGFRNGQWRSYILS
jgi:Sensors of blue-light using FAD